MTSSRELKASVVEESYETSCVYDLSDVGEVALHVFHATEPEYLEALRDGTVWTPGELPNTGYQGPDRTDGGASVVYARAVTIDAAASVAITLAGSDEELVAVAVEVAARTVDELLEHR